MTTARAHPNVALIKYWGKQAKPGNFPATPSLSITLSELTTTTRVDDADEDALVLNGNPSRDAKIVEFVAALRTEFGFGPLAIETDSNFPTSAGLASSASGFAALITAIDAHCGLELDAAVRSQFARRGSASAARSLFGGYVTLEPPNWQARPLAAPEHWDLRVAVAVTSTAPKKIGSTEGMERSRLTSPYFDAWVGTAAADFEDAVAAINQRDFDKLTDVAELSCMKMHGLMLTSKPALNYWNGASVDCMNLVRELRAAGHGVFFTNDAGPQIKAICLPAEIHRVAAELRGVPGVIEVLESRLGGGAAADP